MQPNMVLAFRIDGRPEQVTVRVHPRARCVRLRVLPPGQVVVTVPRRFARNRLPEILAEHADWLGSTLSQVRAESARWHAEVPPSVVSLPALDTQWTVDTVVGAVTRLSERQGGVLRLTLAPGADWREPLRRWLHAQARAHLPPWLAAVAREFGLGYTAVSIRAQKTRWGSCSARGRISLNRNLLLLGPQEVRYLLIHELCHTRHLNHSTQFWASVARCMPGYRDIDRGLRKAQQRLPGWAQPMTVL